MVEYIGNLVQCLKVLLLSFIIYIYLKPKLKENSIRFQIKFQLWANFVSCIYLIFLIFVLSKWMNTVGVIGPRAHIYVYIGLGAQSKDVR